MYERLGVNRAQRTLYWHPEPSSASLVDYRTFQSYQLTVCCYCLLSKHAFKFTTEEYADKLRNATRAVHTCATKCLEVEGGIFENLMQTEIKSEMYSILSMRIKPILFVSISVPIYCYFVTNFVILQTPTTT